MPRPLIKIIIAALVLCLPPARPAAATAGYIRLGDTVLQQDAVWSGIVVVDGVVVVGRRARLTITPGTVVLCMRRDSNHDGVGDSEIRVLGQIVAQGTAEHPIVFKSGEKKPAPLDWSYLLIFTSGKVNTLSYCQFHDAFSGLQVHFSTATVSDCLFSGNREGIRFGRAKLKIRHNEISGNKIGIRFTRMEGPAEIRDNEIHDNRVGIFLVPSGQNIVDFFEPGRTGRPWNEGHLEITGNNLHHNFEYNLKLGAKQMWDLRIINNWWGATRPASIERSIFDRRRDRDLGRAIFLPLAEKPFPEAGIRPPGSSNP